MGLSALMVTGCTLPALAAENVTKKEETVYVVLEPDGSVRSQTVSSHLHNESGLSGVTDRSALRDIENTRDSASFTQNGEELSWDTDKADVYYKGSTDKSAPISAKITYELDGTETAPKELEGKSGHVKLTVQLVNNETGTVQTDGRLRPVCTPFVTMVAAVLGEGWTDISAEHGRLSGTGNTQAVGFVCLPGVRECLEGIGSDKLEELEDHLLDTVSIEGDVTDFTLPDILVACATDAQTLKENGFSGLEELEGLDEGMDSLREGMDELLDGAGRLSEGASELESGAAALVAGIDTLYGGGARLQEGVLRLQSGAHDLSGGAAQARDGAAALQSGAGDLAAGLSDLQDGAGALYGGYSQLKAGTDSLAAGLGTLQSNGPALTEGVKQLTGAVGQLYEAAGPDSALMTGAQTFGSSLSGAASGGAQALAGLPDPSVFAGSSSEDPAYRQLLEAYTGAYNAAGGLSGALTELDSAYSQVLGGMQQVSAGIGSLQEGANGSAGLMAGISAYTQGVADAASGATQLQAGVNRLGDSLPALTSGVDRLVDGSNRLSSGAGSLSQGSASLADGAQQLAKGTDDLATGTSELLEGTRALAEGASDLHSGTKELSDGASDLYDGLKKFDSEGVSKLTGAAEDLPALRAVTSAMRERAEDYGSFAGAAEGTHTTTRFVMKTAGLAEKTEPAEEPTPQEDGEEHESFLQRFVDLFKK